MDECVDPPDPLKSSARGAATAEFRSMGLMGAPRVLIVASTAPALEELLQLCTTSDRIRVTGGVKTGESAIEAAGMQRPNIVLAAAPLADMSNRSLVVRLPRECRHSTVVVTANAEDIARSLEAGVAECILRPLTPELLHAALLRARARGTWASLETERAERNVGGDAEWPASREAGTPLVLVGERERRLYPLEPRRIDYIQSADNYVKLCVGRTQYIARDTIKRLYPSLRALGFIRIERSLLVNIRAVSYVEPIGRGVFAFELSSGDRLRSSPAYGGRILQVLPLRRRESIRGGRRSHPADAEHTSASHLPDA